MMLMGDIEEFKNIFDIKIVVSAIICKTFRIRVLITSR